MMTVMDYVKKVGNYSFTEIPYNEVDLMALIDVSYLPIERWVPSLNPGHTPQELPAISLMEVAQNFKQQAEDCYAKNHVMTTKYRASLLDCMAKYPRYRGVLYQQMYEEVNRENCMDYSSFVYRLPGVEEQFVVFRGSNDSLISWKENLQLVTLDTVLAHQVTIEYLNEIYQQLPGPFVLTGHSKGGNLALFGAYLMDYHEARSPFIELKKPFSVEQIKKVVIFDGPGLSPKFMPDIQEHPLVEKTIQYIPESAVVGSRFYSPVRPEIVASRSFSVFQHDLRFWEVNGGTNQLQKADQVTALSFVFNKTYEEWFSEFSKEEILSFYDVFLDLLALMGYASFNDVDDDLFNFLGSFQMYYHALSDDAQALIDRLGYRFLEIAKKNFEENSALFSTIKNTKEATLQLYLKYEGIKDAIEETLAKRFSSWKF